MISINEANGGLAEESLIEVLAIDIPYRNSEKNFLNQAYVTSYLVESNVLKSKNVSGVMIESNLRSRNQLELQVWNLKRVS